MNPATVKLGLSILEMLGTSLLAIEAIKLKNIKWLRQKFLEQTKRWMNPEIRFLSAKAPRDFGAERAFNIFLSVLVLAIAISGTLIIYVGLHLFGLNFSILWNWFITDTGGLHPVLVSYLSRASIVVFSGWAVIAIGVVFYSAAVAFLGLAIRMLSFIEKQTATGVIGIIGISIYLLSVGCRAYMDWSAGY